MRRKNNVYTIWYQVEGESVFFHLNNCLIPMTSHADSNLSDPEFLSPAEFAQFSGLSLPTIHRYRKSGRLPFIQPGGFRCRILIPKNASDLVRKNTFRQFAPRTVMRGSNPRPRYRDLNLPGRKNTKFLKAKSEDSMPRKRKKKI